MEFARDTVMTTRHDVLPARRDGHKLRDRAVVWLEAEAATGLRVRCLEPDESVAPTRWQRGGSSADALSVIAQRFVEPG